MLVAREMSGEAGILGMGGGGVDANTMLRYHGVISMHYIYIYIYIVLFSFLFGAVLEACKFDVGFGGWVG